MRSVWTERIWLAAAALLALGIVGFYASRLGMALPIFAGDEGTYLIRAIYPPERVANNPFVNHPNNGVHLSLIRAAYALGAPLVLGDRLVNAAAYLAGLGLMWRAGAQRLPRGLQVELGLIALAFPYYRFAFSNLAEGPFVGVLLLLCLATGRWCTRRPMLHAVVSGALAAVLVLVKANGVAVIVALGAVAVLEAAAARSWRRLPLRIILFAATFFALGNLVEWRAQEPVSNPLSFFIGDVYGRALSGRPAADAPVLALLELAAMVSAMALLAGAPILIGVADVVRRWRATRGRFELAGSDLVFLLLTLALGATLAMVTLFAIQVSGDAGETRRLWGRYFEFFAPLIWLAAGPALARPFGRATQWACAAVMAAGLAGLLACFRAGIVLFPWDAGALLAFFAPDPLRASLNLAIPYRGLAVAAAVLAVLGLALRFRPSRPGLFLTLALALLSTSLDRVWLDPMIRQREVLNRDIRHIKPALPLTGEVDLLAPDANDGHLGFLLLDARPIVRLGPIGETPPPTLRGAAAVIVSGPEVPPGGPWVRSYGGEELSLFRPAP